MMSLFEVGTHVLIATLSNIMTFLSHIEELCFDVLLGDRWEVEDYLDDWFSKDDNENNLRTERGGVLQELRGLKKSGSLETVRLSEFKAVEGGALLMKGQLKVYENYYISLWQIYML